MRAAPLARGYRIDRNHLRTAAGGDRTDFADRQLHVEGRRTVVILVIAEAAGSLLFKVEIMVPDADGCARSAVGGDDVRCRTVERRDAHAALERLSAHRHRFGVRGAVIIAIVREHLDVKTHRRLGLHHAVRHVRDVGALLHEDALFQARITQSERPHWNASVQTKAIDVYEAGRVHRPAHPSDRAQAKLAFAHRHGFIERRDQQRASAGRPKRRE